MSAILVLYLLVPPTEGSLCTSYDRDFDEYRYEEGIAHCRRNVATWRKDAVCRRDGVSDRSGFTVDHIIPLSIGGSNHDDNLWCQHKSLSVTGAEYDAYLMMRDRGAFQADAIDFILDKKFNYGL